MDPRDLKTEPKVSIGLPVRNGEKHIRSALDSLLSQTFTDYELIVSDNASTDRTWEILKEYAKKDSRIVLHRQEKNIGAVSNFEFVLNNARGEYFLWAAHDDYVSSTYISTLLGLLMQNKHVALAGSNVINIEHDGTKTETGNFDDAINDFKGVSKIRSFLFFHRTAWIYGLHRTEFLRYSFAKYLTDPIIASDRLFLYYYIFNDKLAATSGTTIYNRNKPQDNRCGHRPKGFLAYLLWSMNFSIKALLLLFRANIPVIYKIHIAPSFLRYLLKLLRLSTFVNLITVRVENFLGLKATCSR